MVATAAVALLPGLEHGLAGGDPVPANLGEPAAASGAALANDGPGNVNGSATEPSSRTRLESPTVAAPLGDLVVVAEAASSAPRDIPIVLTWTNRKLATEVVLTQRTDASASACFPRHLCTPHDDGAVACVDVGFPSTGAHALQLTAATGQLGLFVPDCGTLQITTVEADGSPLRAMALVEVRVGQATPPADRLHRRGLDGGRVLLTTEAAGLQFEVVVVTGDGRRSEPTFATGPATVGANASCVVRMPPRPMLSARVLDTHGRPFANTNVEVWLPAVPLQLDEGQPTNADGIVTFPRPRAWNGGAPLTFAFSADSGNGRRLHGSLVAAPQQIATTQLGAVRMQDDVLLVAGTCVDANGVPVAGLRLYVQTPRLPEQRRISAAGMSDWIDLAMNPVCTADDGTFRCTCAPWFGRPLRLRVSGLPAFAAFVEGDANFKFVLPPERVAEPSPQ
ncbi:MAG: hypothetical protein WAT39_07485 [Planctomycetota bacterium]